MAPRPLLLLTRPRPQAARFAAAARARLGDNLPVLIAPLLQIVPVGEPARLDGVAGLIVTSENALAALPRPLPAGLTAWCVGPATAAAARAAGLRAEVAGGDADTLVALLGAARPAGRLLHLRGVHARGAVTERLRAAGLDVAERIVYDQRACPLPPEALATIGAAGCVLVPLFSPRSAALAGAALTGCAAPLMLACMSPAVRAAWAGPRPAAHRIAAQPSAESMLETLAQLIAAAGAG